MFAWLFVCLFVCCISWFRSLLGLLMFQFLTCRSIPMSLDFLNHILAVYFIWPAHPKFSCCSVCTACTTWHSYQQVRHIQLECNFVNTVSLWYIQQSVTFRFQNFSVSKLFHFFDGFGFGIEKIWYRKKYRIRYRKNLISEKSFGFGFVQIWGIVTHWYQESLSCSIALNAGRGKAGRGKGEGGNDEQNLMQNIWRDFLEVLVCPPCSTHV